MRHVKLIRMLLSLLAVVTMLSGNAQAALLDVGPTIPQEIGSSGANIKLGYPSWYRDTNRLPLELCMNEAMCFYAPNTPGQPDSFPGNVADELFYYAADAAIALPLPPSGGQPQAILVQAIEAAYSTGGVVPGAQITFARIRVRVDTPVVGTYVVTTPVKQYTFDVTVAADGINFSEDIGIGADGVFTGALAGSVGPFLYCTDAPFPATDGSGGSYIGKNALACPVLGSTFTDPVTGLPANIFRVQGPAGFGTVETNLFRVQGKIYEPVITAPLTVDKATYALDSAGMQVNVFATTDAMSNRTNPGALFPLNFALTNVPSALRLSGAGITTQALTTNSAADGKFFASSGLIPAPVAVPATVTVTNTADTPDTAQTVNLVDEVVINAATYNPLTKILSITASSLDTVNAPVLQAFMPGMTEPLPGGLNVQFPVIDTTVTPNKTYAIPPLNVTVTSTKGGAATAPVSTVTPHVVPATGATLTPGVASPQTVGTAITFTAAATGGDAGPYEYSFFWKSTATVSYTQGRAYSTTPTWTWDTAALALPAGTYTILVHTRHVGSTLASEIKQPINFTLAAPPAPPVPATGAILTPGVASPQTVGTAITFTAAATGGDAGPYEYSFFWRLPNATSYIEGRAYSTTPTWTWNTAARGLPVGTYTILVHTRHVGSTLASEVKQSIKFKLN